MYLLCVFGRWFLCQAGFQRNRPKIESLAEQFCDQYNKLKQRNGANADVNKVLMMYLHIVTCVLISLDSHAETSTA
jgi:hypothetical protein